MPRFTRLEVHTRLLDEALVPLFHHADADTACQAVSAIAAGGAGVCEFTNRGDHAIDVFTALERHCARHVPGMILGVGSVVDDATAALFIAHGANFVVGPSSDERTARLCNRRRIAYIPGCQTATEIVTAEEMGAEIIKLFPARSAGGPDFVKQLLGPAPATRLLATGIGEPTTETLAAWFGAGVCGIGLGSALVRADWLAAGDFAALTRRVAEVRHLIGQVRGRG